MQEREEVSNGRQRSNFRRIEDTKEFKDKMEAFKEKLFDPSNSFWNPSILIIKLIDIHLNELDFLRLRTISLGRVIKVFHSC
jgi:hypothetical protein